MIIFFEEKDRLVVVMWLECGVGSYVQDCGNMSTFWNSAKESDTIEIFPTKVFDHLLDPDNDQV